jgi:hypothetical protein
MTAKLLPFNPPVRLACSACGKETNAACDCGAEYRPIEIAKDYAKANPNASIRKIARESGVSHATAQRAKADVSPDTPTNGDDGKQYPARHKPRTAPIEAPKVVETEPSDGVDFAKLKKQAEELALASRDEHLTPAQARELADILEPTCANLAGIIETDAQRKRCTKEAKNPQKVLDDVRKQEQRNEMYDARDEAKREARECGDRWSDVGDDWEAEWLADNWDDKREQEFLETFKIGWRREHGQEFPGSDFAPKAGGAA